jgi:serine/threonine protein phosphatase PrpC
VLKANEDLLAAYREKRAERREILSVMEHAVQEGCGEIYSAAQKDEAKRGMGTTLSALLLAGERGFIAHVGDSRIYLARQGNVHRLTEDHSLVNELIKRGRLKAEEAETAPFKNAVTRAVGVYESVEVDTFDFDALPGDEFVLCTDGLAGYLKDHEIPALMATRKDGEGGDELDPAARAFIALANERGGKDNITAVVVRLAAEGDEAAAAGKPAPADDVTLKLETLKGIPLLRHLTYTELMRVLNVCEAREYGPGGRMIAEGDAGDELFMIIDGQVQVTKAGTVITYLGRGGHFGEMALVDRAVRSASVAAEQRTSVLVLRREKFYDIVRNESALSVKLLWSFVQVLTERLRWTSEELGAARGGGGERTDLAETLSEEDLVPLGSTDGKRDIVS